jgi:glycosyltransferase involved in cell wall biosynthesis
MKILITSIGHYLDKPSGSSKIAFDEALRFASQGDEVWVLAEGPASAPEHEVHQGVHLLRYVPERHAAWSPARRTAHQLAATRLLQKYLPRVDVVHGHVPLTYLAALDLYEKTARTCYTVHSPARMEMEIGWKGSGWARRLVAPGALAVLNRMERDALSRSQVITALSRYTIGLISEIHGREIADRIQLIPGWTDTNRFRPAADRDSLKAALGWRTDVTVFFTLRRLVPRMGLEQLMEAAGQLAREGKKFQLAIGGGGPLAEALAEQSRKLGLEERVTFMGRISDETLPSAYAACDAFVLPTAALEGFGIIALEALASGRPVLATPVGGIPEILVDVEPKWMATSTDANSIARLLRDYLDGRLPQHRPSELREFVESRFVHTLDNFAEYVVGSRIQSACRMSRT